MNRFADMLCFLRRREGLSQLELAEKLGLSKSAISMYESGARKPSFEILEAIADYFNINMDTLMGNDKARSSPETILSNVETSLVSAWRRADDKARRKVAIDLEDFGFEYDGLELSLAARGGKTAPLDGAPDAAEIEAAVKETPSESE